MDNLLVGFKAQRVDLGAKRRDLFGRGFIRRGTRLDLLGRGGYRNVVVGGRGEKRLDKRDAEEVEEIGERGDEGYDGSELEEINDVKRRAGEDLRAPSPHEEYQGGEEEDDEDVVGEANGERESVRGLGRGRSAEDRGSDGRRRM